MALRSQRFDVFGREWASHDQLDRDRRALAFCEALVAAADASLILVNGEWGAGKTFFLDRCAEILRSANHPKPHVVEFNAWRQSHLKDPLLDMTNCMTVRLDAKTRRSLRTVARRVARNMALSVNDAIARKTWGLVDFRHALPRKKSRWEVAEQKLAEFGQRLQREAQRQKIILLIDELDRCEPTYALAVVETAHHLFRVPNVHIVIAVNQGALEHSVRSTYGPDYDVERYLRRFVDSTHQLPDPPTNVVAGYISSRLSGAGRLPDELNESACYAPKLLSLAVMSPTRSIRDVDIAVRLMQRVLAGIRAQHERLIENGSTLKLTQLIDFAALVVALRLAAPDSYRLLVQAPTDGMEAWRVIQKKLGHHFDHRHTDSKANEYMYQFFAYLVALEARARPTGSRQSGATMWSRCSRRETSTTSSTRSVRFDVLSRLTTAPTRPRCP